MNTMQSSRVLSGDLVGFAHCHTELKNSKMQANEYDETEKENLQ